MNLGRFNIVHLITRTCCIFICSEDMLSRSNSELERNYADDGWAVRVQGLRLYRMFGWDGRHGGKRKEWDGREEERAECALRRRRKDDGRQQIGRRSDEREKHG